MKKKMLLMSVIAILSLCGCGPKYCQEPGCPKESARGSDYCYSHKCWNLSCDNRIASSNSSYCTECLGRVSK